MRLGEVANNLNVSPSALRRWTKEFASELSESATRRVTENRRPAQRRFSDLDYQVLQQVRELLDDGLRYKEVLVRLKESRQEREIERHVVDVDSLQIEVLTLKEELEARK